MEPASPNTANPAEIISVEGYSARYARAVDELLGIEGGLSDDPVDRGGTTKYGISLRFLVAAGAFDDDKDGKADFDLDMDGDIDGADVRMLTVQDARYLYLRHFWQPLGAEGFPVPIGEMLFDQAVNGGLVTAKKLLQRAINQCLLEGKVQMGSKTAPAQLAVDGKLGVKTREALAWVLRYPSFGMTKIVMAFREAVRERYRQIVARFPSQKKFLRGWLARAERLGRT